MTRRPFVPLIVATLALLAPTLCASTYTVSASGGGQFTDIQSAIAAAQPGDVLLVAAGAYSAFTLDKGLVVIGQGVVTVTGTSQVVNVPAGQRAALSELRPHDLVVAGCDGTVILQHLPEITGLVVSQSNDVRASSLFVDLGIAAPDAGADVIRLDNCRFELVDSTIVADTGAAAGPGGSAIRAGPSTRLHASRSLLRGGRGGNTSIQGQSAGDGGTGLTLASPCEVFLTGPSGSAVEGETGGIALWNPSDCSFHGFGACAISGGGTVRHSGVSITGGYTQNHVQSCTIWPGAYEPAFCGPTAVLVSPVAPSLSIGGNPAPGGMISFTLFGEPGATAVLRLGRNPVLNPTPGADIEVLAGAGRVVSLGVIPAIGHVQRNALLPSSYPLGLLFVAQADVIGSSGLQRTNSVPIIVR